VFDPKSFVDRVVSELRGRYGGVNCVLAAVSGGVDSTTAAVLTYRALGDIVKPVFIDTGFMRLNEGVRVRDALKNLMPLEIVDYSQEFYRMLEGLEDAEVKRRVFREVFYDVLSTLAREFNCSYVVQGTIAPDWIETLGGIKTQHNVLTTEFTTKRGFRVIEPLRDLYKDQVRVVAKYLGIPSEIIHRQPFPGPGLLIRTVGRFTRDKLEVVRKATEVVESYLSRYMPSQYFAAIWDYDIIKEGRLCNNVCLDYEVFNVKATGVKGDVRAYENIALVKRYEGLDIYELYKHFEDLNYSHVVILLGDKGYGNYFISVRSVETRDFMTANVSKLPINELVKLADELLSIDRVRAVGYDVTPKPPATIEYE